jgi:RNA polymerase sigma-70 factor (ECF subfamily)
MEATHQEWLCHQAASGDMEALTQLLGAHHAALLGFARRKVGPEWRGKIDPEDLLQEAYIQVCANIGGFTYTDESSFYHWAARIISNLYVDAARSWRAAKRDLVREAALPAGPSSSYAGLLERCLPANDKTASHAMQLDEAIGCLMHCIARLQDGRAVDRLQKCLGHASRFFSSHNG